MNPVVTIKNFGSKYKNTLSILSILIVLFILYMIFDRKPNTEINENTNITATTTPEEKPIITTTNPNYTIEQVPINEERGGMPSGMPNLNRPISFALNVNFEQEVTDTLTAKIIELQNILKSDPTNFQAWLDLGIYYKMIGDLEGAIDIWVYTTKLSPTNYLAFGNLGNLYAYNLKDMAMADSYYRQAISKDTSQVYLYIQLAEAYRDVGSDKAKALEVVNQGLTANPNNPALLQLKENLE